MLPIALLAMQATLPVSVVQGANDLSISNGQINVRLDRKTGQVDLKWSKMAAIQSGYAVARLGTETLSSKNATKHEVGYRNVADKFGKGVQAVFVHTQPGKPQMRQVIAVYEGRAEAILQLELADPKGVQTNYLSPIQTDTPVHLQSKAPLQCLFVPYDNDNYFRFNTNGWGEGEGNSDGSYEVSALYEDATRLGLVIGSIDHNQWKSAVRFFKGGGVRVVAGVSSKYTHDIVPHGQVSGKTLRSPRFVFGLYSDWRTGMERYGDLNALVQPPLVWASGVPMGWNSWSGHKDKVSLKAVETALDFIKNDIPYLRSGNTAYINFDSFWDKLTRDERIAFVKKVHAAGLKAGIYWTPFVNWGEPTWKATDDYTYQDLQLKDHSGKLLPKLDGGWPLDPTHPGTLQRIDDNIRDFLDQGFDYIKLDFMTHGALEGAHFDKHVSTGTEAYRIGMERLILNLSVRRALKPVFISLSIAPMFPHGYAHARRISCDAFSNIGASEYLLNSQTYGWWQAGRLYAYNDPDSACVYQTLGEPSTTLEEGRTRFSASVIAGGMLVESDDLTNPVAAERVRALFSNRAAIDLAKLAPSFRPVYGDTGERSTDVFHYDGPDGEHYLALFNFSNKTPKTHLVSLNRVGLPAGLYHAEDLWSKTGMDVKETLSHTLAPMDCAIFKLTQVQK